MWGRSSDTSVPHWPRLENLYFDPSRFPVLVRTREGIAKGSGLPDSRVRRGLGSKRSTWDGPPAMKRKITFFARGGYMGERRASGLADGDAPATASRAIKSASPSMPKPPAKRWSASRRLTGRGPCPKQDMGTSNLRIAYCVLRCQFVALLLRNMQFVVRNTPLRQQQFQVVAAELADQAVIGADDRVGQVALGLLELEDLFFDRVLGDEAIGEDLAGLADAVGAVDGLSLD